MTNKELLISRITQLSEDEISSVLNAVTLILEAKELAPKPGCPYCGSPAVIRYGHKCNKQRFRRKSCVRTFVTTTNTIMSNSHFSVSVWKEMISDTLHGNAIDYSAKRLGLYHQAAFDMRHKILLALQGLPEAADVCLGEVSEFDETFVLDCYKGRKLESTVSRAPAGMVQKRKKEALESTFTGISFFAGMTVILAFVTAGIYGTFRILRSNKPCLMVEGKEVKRYKNIELPDSIKEVELLDFHFIVPSDGKITFEIHYVSGVLPETFPKPRAKVTRAEKAAANHASGRTGRNHNRIRNSRGYHRAESRPPPPEPAEEADANQEARTMEISYNVTGPAAKSCQVSRLAEKQPSEMEGLFCIKVCPFRQHLNKFACNPHKH